MSAPEEVVELARLRLAARAAKDWTLADKLRNKIAEFGFEVLDVADGFEFKLKSPFPIVSRINDLRRFTDKSFESSIAVPLSRLPLNSWRRLSPNIVTPPRLRSLRS